MKKIGIWTFVDTEEYVNNIKGKMSKKQAIEGFIKKWKNIADVIREINIAVSDYCSLFLFNIDNDDDTINICRTCFLYQDNQYCGKNGSKVYTIITKLDNLEGDVYDFISYLHHLLKEVDETL
jgi:hypothetical protein